MTSYTVQSPVLFMIFKRPGTTRQVFERIRAAKPSRLYISADGPRPGNDTDPELCRQAREVVANIDWDCTVKTLFFEENKGCKVAVSSGISWFFEQEEEGIILEDDCLPSASFFYFCDTLLQKYRHDTRVRNITGTNSQMGRQWGNASYYFSQYCNVWGWATWRRVWKEYDGELSAFSDEEGERLLHKVFPDPFLAAAWSNIFKDQKAGKIDTWDYQLQFLTFFANGLCAVPNTNLVSNIGFGEGATHTFDADNHSANTTTGELWDIQHPLHFVPEKQADYYFFRKEYDLDIKWKRHNKLKSRFRRWVKGLFSNEAPAGSNHPL
jgi:hypothetical protein